MEGRRAMSIWWNLIKGVAGGQRERFNYAMTILALHSKAQKENQQPRKNKIGEKK
jgi:hypothetical protein